MVFSNVHRPKQYLRSAAFVIAGVLCTTGQATAQYLGGGTKTGAEAQIADIEDMRDKFVALARAFPDSTYDWTPMQGVRSVRAVFTLIANEATLFPTMWSFDRPSWVSEASIGTEQARVAALGKDGITHEIERAYEHLLAIVRGLDASERSRRVNFFGLTVDLDTAISLMANDMHEHLGQAIAYARMNHIVPPWSR